MSVRTIYDIFVDIDRTYTEYRDGKISRKRYLFKGNYLKYELEGFLRRFISCMTIDDFLELLYKSFLAMECVTDYTISKVYKIVRKLLHERLDALLTDHMMFLAKRLEDEGIYLAIKPESANIPNEDDESSDYDAKRDGSQED